MKLTEMSCEPCRKSDLPLRAEELFQYLEQLTGWRAVEIKSVMRLEKEFQFSAYMQGVTFVNKLAKLAEIQDHHPEIVIRTKTVLVSWWTHAIRGLHMNDFISAAKTDALYEKLDKRVK